MELLISAYIIIGMMFSTVIWWAAFSQDYDSWHRDTYKDEPPTTQAKLSAMALAPIVWPLYLYWLLR